MKTLTFNNRFLAIVNKAVALGYDLDKTESIEETLIQAEDFLIENAEASEEYCSVDGHGASQTANYADNSGYEYNSSGEIIDWANHRFDGENEKVFYTTIVNNNGDVIKLYDIANRA